MSEKNYYNREAIQKLKELAEDARICMMCTQLDAKPMAARPMTVQEVDEQGIIWFISGKDSDKNYQLQKDSELQLFFANNGSSEYLSIYGHAEIYADRETIEEHWSAMANAWFEEGKDDPNVSIIGVNPKDVRYWDTKHGKFVDMALMLYAAVTGSDTGTQGGEEGKLEI
ncbi:MAG: pyridoxamine 5'-phosphate oxidase family protein [Flavobacteriaceae bacterium]|nr:pyridoxamine 5'-phosphate oxidase family protein [Flavobacteriaceae bacterium]